MPDEYTKLAEGIVKGSVPMVASFVERYVSDDEPGFFVGDREHVDGDVRIHVTLFAYLDQPDSRVPEPSQLGIVDLQQLPDERVWMVVGGQPELLETQGWLNDLYSAMIRRMAARLVQFGFLDAPNRPRLRSASTLTLTHVANALKPPKPAPAAEPLPAEPVKPPLQTAARVSSPAQAAEPARSVAPAEPAAPVVQAGAGRAAPPTATAASPLVPEANPLTAPSGPQLDLMLTIAMVVIWVVACGMLSYLLVLLLR
jgi:hypothetical protein